MKKITLFLSLILLFSLNGKSQLFSSSPKLRCFILKAPEKLLPGVKKIAIMDFEIKKYYNEDNSRAIVEFMTAELMKEKRGIGNVYAGFSVKEGKTFMKGFKTNFYTVVERGEIDKVLKEQGFSMSGMVDESKAAEVGNLLGVDAIITGSGSYTHKDTKEVKTYKDKEGKTHRTYYVRRTLNAEARMKIISVETGQVLGTKSVAKSVSESKSSKSGYQYKALTSPKFLAKKPFQQIASSFVDYFCPSFGYQKFTFEKVKNKQFKKKIKSAKKYLKDNDIKRAYPVYKAVYDNDSYSPVACYNLGIFSEATGDFIKAKELYDAAYELDPDDSDFRKAVNRVEKNIEAQKMLAELGIVIEPMSLEGNNGDALADKVELKGDRSDRISVYSDPDKGSKVVAKVPGGLKFPVIKHKGDWYLIKLRGTKKGFVHKKDVD